MILEQLCDSKSSDTCFVRSYHLAVLNSTSSSRWIIDLKTEDQNKQQVNVQTFGGGGGGAKGGWGERREKAESKLSL